MRSLPHTLPHTASPLRRARQLAGLSQERLAALAGVSQDTIWRAETGQRKPQVSSMRAIAGALGLLVEDVFPVEVRVRPVTPTNVVWPPPPRNIEDAVYAYRAAGDSLGAAELLGLNTDTIRRRLNHAGAQPRPRGGSRKDGVESLASWGRKLGAPVDEVVAAAMKGRVPGAFLERLDCPVLGLRWAVRS